MPKGSTRSCSLAQQVPAAGQSMGSVYHGPACRGSGLPLPLQSGPRWLPGVQNETCRHLAPMSW